MAAPRDVAGDGYAVTAVGQRADRVCGAVAQDRATARDVLDPDPLRVLRQCAASGTLPPFECQDGLAGGGVVARLLGRDAAGALQAVQGVLRVSCPGVGAAEVHPVVTGP